jgi:hypothetical protein
MLMRYICISISINSIHSTMKKILITSLMGLILISAYSQRPRIVPYYNWSNPTSFQVSPAPLVTGYGYFSDSLSKVHKDTTFYEYQGEYYAITSWADYYLWYVNKYWYQFNEPQLYNFFYFTGNDYGMASYICGWYFKGYNYPSRICVTFPDREVYVNNLSWHHVKKHIRNDASGYYSRIAEINTREKVDGNETIVVKNNPDDNILRVLNKTDRDRIINAYDTRKTEDGNLSSGNLTNERNFNYTRNGGQNEYGFRNTNYNTENGNLRTTSYGTGDINRGVSVNSSGPANNGQSNVSGSSGSGVNSTGQSGSSNTSSGQGHNRVN